MLRDFLKAGAFAPIFLTLSIAHGALAAPGAHAQSVTRSERVRVDDLDLTTEGGLAKLDRRIRSAARKVCSLSAPHQTVLYSVSDPVCIKKAHASAAAARVRAVERALAARDAGQPARVAVIRMSIRPTFVAEEAPKPGELAAPRAQ